MTQLGFKLIEDGLAETAGYIADHTSDSTTDGILSIFCFNDTLRQIEHPEKVSSLIQALT